MAIIHCAEFLHKDYESNTDDQTESGIIYLH
jgi:hypothetical protein